MSGNRIIASSIIGLALLVFAMIWLTGWTCHAVPESAWYKYELLITEVAAAIMLLGVCLVGIIIVGPERQEKEKKA